MREELAPMALTAFPEAYEDFKQATLLLLYGQEHAESPVSDLWSAHRRADLAGQLARTIRQAAGVPCSLLCCQVAHWLQSPAHEPAAVRFSLKPRWYVRCPGSR